VIDNTDQANQLFELLKNKGKIKDKK
jgi:alkaline phosphatase